MTNFRSEETRRHDGMAEVEGSKWRRRHDNPFGPTTISNLYLLQLTRLVLGIPKRLLFQGEVESFASLAYQSYGRSDVDASAADFYSANDAGTGINIDQTNNIRRLVFKSTRGISNNGKRVDFAVSKKCCAIN